ncbi:hypothetical protein BDK51DRAFT_42145 [Blyttiomyces helicus]|uniref:Uncharacterized protein n=1 Tax=Blyttiomyces helicus TaxID=388810 RepID=A0A4P9WJ87_9FUNG|nr:hypothetical protein BDK51DRAFT_42145 [Blyttiomyces helicus]|eukprot:RKO92422.1 hypothetical protein BDK51DRAFT_42145 [Blyttiomyces helicus]
MEKVPEGMVGSPPPQPPRKRLCSLNTRHEDHAPSPSKSTSSPRRHITEQVDSPSTLGKPGVLTDESLLPGLEHVEAESQLVLVDLKADALLRSGDDAHCVWEEKRRGKKQQRCLERVKRLFKREGAHNAKSEGYPVGSAVRGGWGNLLQAWLAENHASGDARLETRARPPASPLTTAVPIPPSPGTTIPDLLREIFSWTRDWPKKNAARTSNATYSSAEPGTQQALWVVGVPVCHMWPPRRDPLLPQDLGRPKRFLRAPSRAAHKAVQDTPAPILLVPQPALVQDPLWPQLDGGGRAGFPRQDLESMSAPRRVRLLLGGEQAAHLQRGIFTLRVLSFKIKWIPEGSSIVERQRARRPGTRGWARGRSCGLPASSPRPCAEHQVPDVCGQAPPFILDIILLGTQLAALTRVHFSSFIPNLEDTLPILVATCPLLDEIDLGSNAASGAVFDALSHGALLRILRGTRTLPLVSREHAALAHASVPHDFGRPPRCPGRRGGIHRGRTHHVDAEAHDGRFQSMGTSIRGHRLEHAGCAARLYCHWHRLHDGGPVGGRSVRGQAGRGGHLHLVVCGTRSARACWSWPELNGIVGVGRAPCK